MPEEGRWRGSVVGGITRREIEQYRQEFRDSEEGRWRAAAAGTGRYTPYRCGDCSSPLTLEEEGWLQCNACIAADFEELEEELQRRTERSVDRWAEGLDRQQAEQQQQLQEEQTGGGAGGSA